MDTSNTRQQLWKDMYGNEISKAAELANTYDMPGSVATKSGKPRVEPALNKTAEAEEEDLLKLAFAGKTEPETNENETLAKAPEKLPQAAPLKPTASQGPKLTEKKASRFALSLVEQYPLDSYEQVKLASSYFDEYYKQMVPSVRHEYAENLVKRAAELGIAVSETAGKYGSTSFACDEELKIALDARRTLLQEPKTAAMLDKLAEAQPLLSPDIYAATLSAFDELTGLNQYYDCDVPDPFYSTFGKTAAETAAEKEDPLEMLTIGNEFITARQLATVAKVRNHDVKQRFGHEFTDEFAKDPLGIFKSLPRDQKLVLMRLASGVGSNASTG